MHLQTCSLDDRMFQRRHRYLIKLEIPLVMNFVQQGVKVLKSVGSKFKGGGLRKCYFDATGKKYLGGRCNQIRLNEEVVMKDPNHI